MEPTPFDAKRFSHKFKEPSLRFEEGITIDGGDLVWVHGPYPTRIIPRCENIPE